jgi:4-hydroxy-tetrahydrodipicolinate reductase
MRIAIIGYGRMGHMIEEVATERSHEVILRINIDNTDLFTRENLAQADVAIEFSGPSSAYDNIKTCIDFGVPVVSGSTGWNNKLQEIKRYAEERNGSFLHTSNFSIGVNIFFEVNKLLARLMATQPSYDVVLKEIHHTAKLDAPSGTAVSLAEQVLQNIPRKTTWINEDPKRSEDLHIVSERVDPAPGTHFVKYTSPIDDIEIIHTAHNRKGFALGAVLAAEHIRDKKGVFSMQEVLGL